MPDTAETQAETSDAELSLADELRQNIQPVEPEDTMAEAGRKILLNDFVKMLENESGSRIGDDIEHVHDMRVATRRMRSAFRLLDDYYKSGPTRPYISHLSTLGKRLGVVRDLDVMIANLLKYQASLENDAEKEALQHVVDLLGKRRVKARTKLIKHLNSKDFAGFINAYTSFLLKPGKGARAITGDDGVVPFQVRHLLPEIVHEHLAQVRAYDTVLEGADFPTLHALRIEFKRLRYLVDFFKVVLGTSITAFITELKAMQDHLGELNDAAVAQGELAALIDDGKLKKAEKAILRGYMDSLKTEQERLTEGVGEVWSRFNSRTVQRKLSDALLTLR
jgi:CHAD domain-containing protein